MHETSTHRSQTPLSVLLLEDDAADAELILRTLRKNGYEVSATVAGRRREFVETLHDGYDVVLSDFNLPDMDGIGALRIVKESGLDVPVILVSGAIGDELAARCVQAGAADYVVKDRLARLPVAVRGALKARDLDRQKRAAEKELALREAHYRAMIELSLDALVILDLEGRFTYASPAAELHTGFRPEEIVGRHAIDIVEVEDQAQILEVLGEMVAGRSEGQIVTFRIRHRDGSTRTIEARGKNLAGDPAIGGILLTTRDVTEKATAEAERRRLVHELGERVKELGLLHRVSKLLESEHRDVGAILERVVREIPSAWQYPEITAARIAHDGRRFETDGFRETPWIQRGRFDVVGAGEIEITVAYLEERPPAAEGPFLAEERSVLDSIGEMLASHVERHLAAISLRESEARFRELTEALEDVFYLFDLDTSRFLYLSPSFEALTGRSRASLEENPLGFLDLVDPRDRERLAVSTPAVLDRVVREEYRIRRDDGSIRWVRHHLFPIRDAAGRTRRLAGVSRDVTDLKAASHTREQLARMVQSSDDAIVGFTLGRTITSWNSGAEALYGYTAEQAVGAPLWMLYPPGEMEDGGATFDRALHGEPVVGVDARRRTKDGRIVEISLTLSPIHDEDGTVVGIGSTARDVTASRASQRSLAAQTARLERVVESIPIGLSLIDEIGLVTHSNPAMTRIWGRDPLGIGRDRYSEFPARFAASGALVRPEDWPVSRALREGKAFLEEELEVESPSGNARTVLASGLPIRDDGGRLVGGIAVLQDVTERKRYERDLAAARDDALAATRLKTAFLANVSHEIRTPLNVILGYNSLIAERMHELGDASSAPLLEAVDRGGKRLLATIHRILDVARLEAHDFLVHPEVLELAPLIARHARDYVPLAEEKGLALELRLDERDAKVRFDEYCLVQSLRNLLDNAVKFTERGRITVTLDRDPEGNLRLEVADTGVGIEPAFQTHLFEPFTQEESGHTRHFEGTGLGLSLVKRYLDQNGAALEVRSEKGHGASFTIHFVKDRHEVAE